MQCQSYLPVYHSHYDLNMDSNSDANPTMFNGNGAFRSGHCNNYASSVPLPQVPFAFGKEFMRQTMLMHESTFRDQVQELHRLYRRQKELMSEMKSRELYVNRLHHEAQCANSFSAKFSYRYEQNTQHSHQLVHSHPCPSTMGTNSIPVSPNFIKDSRLFGGAIVSQNGGALENVSFPESKAKKIGGKFLDLELPAEVYIDSEDVECFEDARFSEAPISTSLSSNKPSKVAVENPVHLQVGPTTPGFGDLNEPPTVDEANFERKPSSNSDKNPTVVQALPCLANQSSSSKGAKACSRLKRLSDDKHNGSSRRSPSFGMAKTSKSSCFDQLRNINSSNQIDLNSGVLRNSDFIPSNETSSETTRKTKKCRLFDINLPCDPSIEEESLTEDDLVGHDYKNRGQINLNMFMNDDESPSKSFTFNRLEIDLEAPPSPDVEERPPPRGDSEENQPDDLPQEQLVKIAAEAIVSISSSPSKSQPFLENQDHGTLEWFAGLVHFISNELENDHLEVDTHNLDDFEAMTLNLPEMKAEEYLHENGASITSVTCSMPVAGQVRKGRTRRSKRKDFQKEVLPSLASLSRYEVTEDIQMIEGLMEAAGTPWHLTRTRRACRVGRKPRVAKQQSSSSFDVGSELKDCGTLLVSWGKANRRPRARRCPASPSRWLKHVI